MSFATQRFLCAFLVCLTLKSRVGNSMLLDTVYWEVKPYIFVNERNETDGIIPRMFDRAYHLCRDQLFNSSTNQTEGSFINYIHKEDSRHEFHKLLRDGQYGVGKLENVSAKHAFWVPISSYVDTKHEPFVVNKNLKSFRMIKSKSIAVIVPRHVISLPNKIIRGIKGCQQIMVITLILAVFFGILVWFLEHFKNKGFPKRFYKGGLSALWWSMVSMTTVGYGDIVPQSPFGRLVGIAWLFVGLMIGCVMTATMTDVVSGVSDLSVYGKRVSVLAESYEEKIASKDYRADVIPAYSYEDVIHLVRRGKAFAAMINADVAAWYQEHINADIDGSALHIVEILPANININCLVAAHPDPSIQQMFKCMYDRKDEVYDSSYEYFQRYCHIEKLFIGSMMDLLWSSTFIQGLLAVILIMIIVGLTSDLFKFLAEKVTKKSKKDGSRDHSDNGHWIRSANGVRNGYWVRNGGDVPV